MGILLTRIPEVLFTINIIPGLLYKNIFFSWIVGVIFLICVLILFFIKKVKIINNNFKFIILCLVFIFWLPLYLNFFYNNIYDSMDNLEYGKYDINGKRIIRLCSMDYDQKIGGIYCRIFSFIKFTENTLPSNKTIKILSQPSLENYLQYYFYPYFNLTNSIEKADYLVYYYSADFYYKNNVLYAKNADNSEAVVGRYSLLGSRGTQELVLERLKE
jgi:hypothetical protein